MSPLPTMLIVQDRPAVIVGGGSVARRRAAALLDAGARVSVYAPRIDEDLRRMRVNCWDRPYRWGDLSGAFLAVAAADCPEVNETVATEARERSVLLNRADHPEAGDVLVPAHAHRGPLTVGVYTHGASPRVAAAVRDQMLENLDPAWIQLLERIGPLRDRLKAALPEGEARRAALRCLTGPQALRRFHRDGLEGLDQYAEQLIEETRQRG